MPSASSASLRPISWVTIDLTFTTSSMPWALATSATIAHASAASRAQRTVAPAAVSRSSRRTSCVSSENSAASLIAAPASRSSSQFSTSATTRARLSRMVAVACARLRRSWVSSSAALAATGNFGIPTKVPVMTCPFRRGQDLGQVHHAYAGPLAGQRPADVHQAAVVAGDQHLRAGLAHVAGLVGDHRHRGVGVLDREGAAEAAALLGPRQLDEVEAAHRLQQPCGPVADAQHPQRVAGRVVGHAVREVRADVGHPEHVDEELRQLVGPWRGPLDGRRPEPGHPTAARRSRAGAGRTRRTTRTA